MSTLSSSADMNPDLKDPDLYVDRVPLEVFAKLRNEDPVYWNPERDGPGFWALTRHADIVHVSTQPGLFSSAYENGGHRIFNENEVGLTGAGESAIGIPFISRDPPLHMQYRKIVMPALAPGRLSGIEERVKERCAQLIAKIPLNATVDVVPLLSAKMIRISVGRRSRWLRLSASSLRLRGTCLSGGAQPPVLILPVSWPT